MFSQINKQTCKSKIVWSVDGHWIDVAGSNLKYGWIQSKIFFKMENVNDLEPFQKQTVIN